MILQLPFLWAEAQINTRIIPGSIMDTVYCKTDQEQSYALFLPTNYDDKLTWPIVYFFEPAARGTLPLLHFKKAADRYGYILVASNNSRNGSWEGVFKSANAMFQDTYQRFSLDSLGIYTCGFSGGARAALAVAEEYDRITGVLACGAGLPNPKEYKPRPQSNYSYLGIVGDKDMNYLELHKVKKLFDSLKFRNRLLIFDGGHQWPPEETAIEAIRWLEIRSMYNSSVHTDSINSYFEKRIEEARDLKQAGNLYLASNSYEQLILDFEGSTDTSIAKKELNTLSSDKAFKKDAKLYEKLFHKEEMLIDRYLRAFKGIGVGDPRDTVYFKNATWWNNESKYLKRLSVSKITANQLVGKRMVDFIWRRCVETGSNYYDQGDYTRAVMVDQVWAQIQPDKKYPYYRLARSYARLGETDRALVQLQLAVQHGITDGALLTKDPAFEVLQNESTFQKLLTQLK